LLLRIIHFQKTANQQKKKIILFHHKNAYAMMIQVMIMMMMMMMMRWRLCGVAILLGYKENKSLRKCTLIYYFFFC